MRKTKTGLVAILALGSISTATAIRAHAENNDPCGWAAWATASALIAGGGYFVGADEIVGIFTASNALYMTLDFLKIACPSQTLIQPCDDSLGGCNDDTPGTGAGNGTSTDQGDDGSES